MHWWEVNHPQQHVGRPKEITHGPSIRAHDTSHLTQYSIQMQNVQTHVQKGVQGHVSTTPSVLNDGNQSDICDLIQRQNDITALVPQNLFYFTTKGHSCSWWWFFAVVKRKSESNFWEQCMIWVAGSCKAPSSRCIPQWCHCLLPLHTGYIWGWNKSLV